MCWVAWLKVLGFFIKGFRGQRIKGQADDFEGFFAGVCADDPFPCAGAWPVGKQSDHVACYGVGLVRPGFEIGFHGKQDLPAAAGGAGVVVKNLVGLRQDIVWVFIGCTSDHDTIHPLQMRDCLALGADLAVYFQYEVWKIAFQTIHILVSDGGDLAVFLG